MSDINIQTLIDSSSLSTDMKLSVIDLLQNELYFMFQWIPLKDLRFGLSITHIGGKEVECSFSVDVKEIFINQVVKSSVGLSSKVKTAQRKVVKSFLRAQSIPGCQEGNSLSLSP